MFYLRILFAYYLKLGRKSRPMVFIQCVQTARYSRSPSHLYEATSGVTSGRHSLCIVHSVHLMPSVPTVIFWFRSFQQSIQHCRFSRRHASSVNAAMTVTFCCRWTVYDDTLRRDFRVRWVWSIFAEHIQKRWRSEQTDLKTRWWRCCSRSRYVLLKIRLLISHTRRPIAFQERPLINYYL